MPASGIEVSPELNLQWNTLRQDGQTNYIIITIKDMEHFVISQSGTASNAAQHAQGLVADKEPAYVLIRSDNTEKFFIVFYCPLGAKNALKMVYSSSLNALKSGLGSDYLVSEVYATEKREISQGHLDQSTVQHDRVALMTQQEQLQHDAAYASVGSLETQSKVTADLPVHISPAAQTALDALKSGASSTAAFTLNTDTENLEVIAHGNDTPSQIQGKLNNKIPSFIFFNYAHQSPSGTSEKKGIFIYYCPSGAPVKSKMFHSSSKSPVTKILELHGLSKDGGFEADVVTEITDEHIMRVIYPPSQQVTRVAKPLPPHLRRKQAAE